MSCHLLIPIFPMASLLQYQMNYCLQGGWMSYNTHGQFVTEACVHYFYEVITQLQVQVACSLV